MKIIFKNISIVTQNKNADIMNRGFIVIENGGIKKISSGDFFKKNNKKDKLIDGRGKIAIPGLINSHIHIGESAFPPFLPRKYSLEKYIDLTEKLIKKHPEFEDSRDIISDWSLLLSLKSGTTTIAGGRIYQSAKKWGIRYISGVMIMNSNKLRKFYNKISIELKKMKNNIESELGRSALFIHSLPFIDQNKINEISKIKKTNKTLSVFIHFLETKKERGIILKKWHKKPFQILQEANLANKYTHLIHCNWVTKKELQNIIKSGCNIIHCPTTNIEVDDKVLNIKNIINQKGKISIATDGFATSKSLNLFKEARKAFLFHNKNRKIIKAKKIFDLITIEAAKNLNLDRKIGSLEKNKKADIVFLNKINLNNDPYKEIINQGKVNGVLINGEFIIWENKILDKSLSESKIKSKFNNLINKIKKSPQ